MLTPVKRKAGVKMRAAVKENNRRINRLRSVVERFIAPVLTWRVLHTGFRRPLGAYPRVFSSGAGVDFLCGFGPLMNKPLCTKLLRLIQKSDAYQSKQRIHHTVILAKT